MSLLEAIENQTSVSIRTYIDSRDLHQARDEAQGQIDDYEAAEPAEREDIDADDIDECREIVEGVDNIENEGGGEDWAYGSTFIPEHAWIDYVEELAEDIGAIDRDARWPCNHIDWQAAADELTVDYTTVEIDGETYYVR